MSDNSNNGLKITKISIYPVTQSEGRLRAVVRVVLNDMIQLTNMRIYDGSNGLFVSYPVEFTQKGEEFRQIFYPVKKEFREYAEEEILDEYSNVMKKVG
jgi:stage V sporulation protein G